MIGSPQLALSSSANPTATVVTDMSIPTPERLRKQARRPYRRIRAAEGVVNRMRGGNALYKFYVFGVPTWALTDGRRIDPAVAEIVIRHPQIVGVGDALPLGAAAKSQTFRYAEDPDQEDQTKCHQGGPK
jgi:hypothetical protein